MLCIDPEQILQYKLPNLSLCCASSLSFVSALNSGTKLSEKSNSETPEGVPTKPRDPSKIGNYGNHGKIHCRL